MHVRHRSPGNGYRSGSLGMGISTSRISPEASVRGHGLYGSEYRGFSKGFGRGQGGYHKAYQPSPSTPPQRRSTDIFMEAGRLAAEYLVSQGMLPPSVLSTKWHDGSFKKHVGDFQDFRSQEHRLSSSVSDAGGGYGRRRYTDDYSQGSYRNQFKGRRRGGSNRGVDFDREYGRSGWWSDRGKPSPDMEVDGTSRQHEENPVTEDSSSELAKSVSGEITLKREEGGDSELEKQSLQGESCLKTGSSGAGKELWNDGDVSKMSDPSSLSAGSGEVKNAECYDDKNGNQVAIEGSAGQHFGPADDSSLKTGIDLLALCKFVKVPTKTRSSVSMRSSKISCPDGERSTPSGGFSKNTKLPSDIDCLERSSNNMLLAKPHDANLSDSRNSGTSSIITVADSTIVHDVDNGKRSQSFSDSILVSDNNRQLGRRLSDLQRSCSMDGGRGEKRVSEYGNSREETKKQREELPPPFSEVDGCVYLPDAPENKASPQKNKPSPAELLVVGDCNSLVNDSRSPGGEGGSSVSYAEERQLFPGSFKICDLNLEGASDTNDNHTVVDPMHMFPPILEPKKETSPIDFDLSMSSSVRSCDYTTRSISGKEIEIIDLENDSGDDVKPNNLEKKQEGAFMSYSHQSRTCGGIPDVNDYSGLMVEFLNLENIPPITQGINPAGEDISHLQQNVSTLQNEMGFPNSQGTLGDNQGTQPDDDSIFMSLGEIPLTFLGSWDQPPARGYEKPF